MRKTPKKKGYFKKINFHIYPNFEGGGGGGQLVMKNPNFFLSQLGLGGLQSWDNIPNNGVFFMASLSIQKINTDKRVSLVSV